MAWTPAVYRSRIDTQWIDYNGHLRDSYYALLYSLATDAIMDEIGLDEDYRKRTACTLYSLEMHIHYVNEVMSIDEVSIASRLLDHDAKRMQVAMAMSTPRHAEPVSYCEFMLLHVQQGEHPRSAPFPDGVQRKIGEWSALQVSDVPAWPGSRRMEIRRR